MPNHRTHRAFTLIESIAAIVILAVALPAMLWAIRDAAARRADPALIVKANWLAAEKLEAVIADRHSSSRGYAWLIDANYPDEAAVADFPAFSRSVAITQTASDLSTPGVGFKVIAVTVTFPALNAPSRSVTMSAAVSDY